MGEPNRVSDSLEVGTMLDSMGQPTISYATIPYQIHREIL